MRIPKSFTKVTPFSKFLALTLFVLLPILGFYFGIYYQKISPNVTPFVLPDVPSGDIADNAHLNNQQRCADFDRIVNTFDTSELKSSIFDTQERTDHNTAAMSMYFRRTQAEPYITLNSERNTSKYLKDRSVEQIYDILRMNLSPLTRSGFRLNTLNSSAPAKLSYTNQDQSLIYTFIIAGSPYKVVNNKPVDLPRGTIEVNISCASTEPKLTALYDDLLAQKSRWFKNEGDQTMVSVWQNEDNVVYLNVGTIEGGGSGLWLTKVGGIWEVIAKGQDVPECTVFESRNIGKGFDCFRPNVGTVRL